MQRWWNAYGLVRNMNQRSRGDGWEPLFGDTVVRGGLDGMRRGWLLVDDPCR